MNRTPHPSKRHFYSMLRNWLSNRTYAVVIDAASAAFKNASILPATKYVGVDLNKDLLGEGARSYRQGVALYADVRELNAYVPRYSVDLCISTHTIEHLSESDVREFIATLTTLNAKGGDLIFNMGSAKFARLQLLDLIKPLYNKVEVHRYRNFLSSLYESARDSNRKSVRTSNIFARITNRLLFHIENISSFFGIGNFVFVMCHDSLNEEINEFELLQ